MKYEFNKFYCTQCGNEGIPIVRKLGQGREAGHLKKLFCLTCQKETNHVECKENTHYTHDDFMVEFLNHNFTPSGKRVQEYNKLKEMINNGQITDESEPYFISGSARSGEEHLDSES